MEPGKQVRRHRRHVDRSSRDPARQVIHDLLRDADGDIFLRFRGGGADVRGADKILKAQQRMIRLDGFLFEDIEGRAPDLAALEGFDQMLFVDNAAAGTVDDFDAVLHRADRVSIDDIFCLRRERRVN